MTTDRTRAFLDGGLNGRTAQKMPAVVPRRDVEVRKGKLDDLLPGGEFHHDERPIELTAEMVREIIATQLDNGFYRTPAGYVSFSAGFDREDKLLLTMTHWRSFTHAEEDETVRVNIELGELRP